MKKVFSFLSVAAILFFSSCRQDVVENPIIEKSETINSIFARTESEEVYKNNLIILVNEQYELGLKITEIIDLNPNFVGGQEYINEIQTAESDLEIIQILENHGVTNRSEDLMNLLKDCAVSYENFSINNPNFYELELPIRQEILDEIDLENATFGRTCSQQYKIARSRCARSFAIEYAGLAIAAPFTGTLSVWIGGGVVLALFAACLDDANQDYEACKK